MKIAAVLWSVLIIGMCVSGVNDSTQANPELADTTAYQVGQGIAVMLYGAIWIGGLLALALLKFLFGRK